ncbi:M20/M25/M40 family metallo-hydrolase [Solilutibacter silvestris]|uniref:Acetylornithine deacetylase/Succinyl-diaminopimelate desuccinylase n=1 Tax=Solilutibacter silvestris TaxID=1645665 RepID=A0A2K1Q2Q1_9GAMM|nr:M20/M25/M40 family metallo-hydrolase [Lysobacter silvestris]PNS09328.1 Acetylornithine deacetylase/Succinyl-diaminopimelate desuccinylase [Lysobacter silvestris]
MPPIARLACATVSCLFLAIPAWADGLSPPEQKIVAAVDAGQARDIALLQRLVEQNSGTYNPAGVEAVARMLRPEFEALGFRVQWKPLPQTKRAGHLIATHAGSGNGKRILLIGHLDTVFEADSPFKGFRRDGMRAIGPGVGDDKGGDVVMLAALRAMHNAGTLRDADIEVVLTGDEEDVGSPLEVARADLIAAGKRADVALDFENLARENGHDMGSIARRSSNVWTLTARGKSGHSSGIFSKEMGDGAIFELARIITAFRNELPEANLTFNVGLVGGGQDATFDAGKSHLTASGKDNIIAPIALARGDFRTLSAEQTRRVREKMQAIVARHLPQTDAALEVEEHYPPMAPTTGNHGLLAKLNVVNRDLGLADMRELDPLKRGAGDISFVAADIDGLIGMGVSGSGSHAPGESADLDSIARQAKRAAILMTRLAQTPR